MSVRTVRNVLAAQAVTGIVGGALLHAAHWRRRAHASSPVEIEDAVAKQLMHLATSDSSEYGSTSHFVTEAARPYLGDRRWYWWAAAHCPACHGVHTAGQGWEPTEQGAHEQAHEHLTFITDYDYVTYEDADFPCTDPERAAELHQHDDDEDDDDSASP